MQSQQWCKRFKSTFQKNAESRLAKFGRTIAKGIAFKSAVTHAYLSLALIHHERYLVAKHGMLGRGVLLRSGFDEETRLAFAKSFEGRVVLGLLGEKSGLVGVRHTFNTDRL